MKNVWLEFLLLKTDFPLGDLVKMNLDPIEDYFETIWNSDKIGTVIGYNIIQSLVVVEWEDGTIMQCGPKLLELIGSPVSANSWYGL